MLAAAFLTITAATQDPAPDGHIPLTRNEISRLLTTMIIQPAGAPTRCAGRRSADGINTAPGPATTSGKPPPDNERHDLRRGY